MDSKPPSHHRISRCECQLSSSSMRESPVMPTSFSAPMFKPAPDSLQPPFLHSILTASAAHFEPGIVLTGNFYKSRPQPLYQIDLDVIERGATVSLET